MRRLLSSYPDEAPEIIVHRRRGLIASQASLLHEQLARLAHSLVGAEMLYDLAEAAKEFLNNCNRKKVSFHEEMVRRHQTDESEQVAQQKLDQLRLDEQAALERRTMTEQLEAQIRAELEIKERRLKEARDLRRNQGYSQKSPQAIRFNPSLQLLDSVVHSITTVTLGEVISVDAIGSVYASKAESHDIRVRRVAFKTKFFQKPPGQRKLENLVRQMNELALVPPHVGLLQILGATIETSDGEPFVYIASEKESGETLGALLKKCGAISLSMTLKYIQQLLAALAHLHANSIVHREIGLDSIIIDSLGILRIREPGVMALLRELHRTHPIADNIAAPTEPVWPPPELSLKPNSTGRKMDIWAVGAVFLQLVFGTDLDTKSESSQYIGRLPSSCRQFVERALRPDPSERPVALDLLEDPVFSEALTMRNLDLYVEPESSKRLDEVSERRRILYSRERRPSPMAMVLAASNAHSPLHSLAHPPPLYSRYHADFEELQFLGRGGFGEVVKARNRLDDRVYAIKRIRLDPENAGYNKKILREVVTLSRLHHERVIRYYQAWIEGGSGKGLLTGVDQESESEDDFSVGFSSEEEDSDSHEYASVVSGVKSFAQTDWLKADFGPTGRSGEYSSDSVMFDHGDASLESEDESEANGKSSTKPIEVQYLYIQMEYCPNQTLRDIIDEGIDRDEAWRLLRQLAEGLAHIHAQGMIHRDLKPSNVFLDMNGDIKIGDFGLATTGHARVRIAETSTSASESVATSHEQGDGHTSGIGTPFYVSPELQEPGARYNQKVDMYSLGIIFVEMLQRFETAMERANILREVRKREVVLPEVFGRLDMLSATEVAKKLLIHNSRERLSALELLHGPWLPPKLEDEYVDDAIRSMANVNAPHFSRLTTVLFSQLMDRHKDFTYDYAAGNPHAVSAFLHLNQVRGAAERVFRRHGAIELDAPLLLPHLESNSAAVLMDPTGQVVELPSDLTIPFARFVARNGINDLRRFSFDRVYQQNPVGGQPKQPYRCDYDIVQQISNLDSSLEDAEAIKAAVELCEECGVSGYVIKINHARIIEALVAGIGIAATKVHAFLHVLAQSTNIPLTKTKNMLAGELALSPVAMELLTRLAMTKGEINSAAKIIPLLKSDRAVIKACEELQRIHSNLGSFGVKVNVVLDPLLTNAPSVYSGIMFQLVNEHGKKPETLAFGGRYDGLIDRFRHPASAGPRIGAVGASFYVSRLAVSLSDSLNSPAVHHPANHGTDVAVYGHGLDMLPEQLQVVADLWAADIRACYIKAEEVGPEQLAHTCRSRGIQWVVILKDHLSRGPYGAVKLKNIEKRIEFDMPRTELAEHVLAVLNDTRDSKPRKGDPAVVGDTSPHGHDLAGNNPSSTPSLSVTIFTPHGKIKNTQQKSSIMERAVRALSPTLAGLSSGKVMEIIAHDLPRDLVRRVADTFSFNDEMFRKAMEMWVDHKEAAIKLRQTLKSLRDKRDTFVFLYQYKDNHIDFVSLSGIP